MIDEPTPLAFPEHSQRRPLTDELHARPFTPVTAPARILHFALLPEEGAGGVDPVAAYAHLRRIVSGLVDESPEPLPALPPGAPPPRYVLRDIRLEKLGKAVLKWERHTEFVSFALIFAERGSAPLFDAEVLRALPDGWLEAAPDERVGQVAAATLLELLPAESKLEAEKMMREGVTPLLDPESTAVAWLSGETNLAMSDFRIDRNGLTRFAIIATPAIGPRRLGRAAQRVIEMEVYRALSLLALPVARRMMRRLGEIEAALVEISGEIAGGEGLPASPGSDARNGEERRALAQLTGIAADLEGMSAASAFRFGAARAYEQLVLERIESVRETRISERPTFGEFMTRRYSPSMRTVHSVSERLGQLSARAERAANLLRTRVDVSLQAQNQALLSSMDRRAQLQLRLQQTVEGLSVVAISYYAVSLAGYLLTPLGTGIGLDEKWVKAIVALPIIAAVGWFTHRIRERMEKSERGEGE